MDGSVIVALSLLVLAFICLLIVVVVVAVFMRITGGGILPMIRSLFGQFRDEEKDDAPLVTSKPRPDLRAIAQQHDFNAALAQQVIENQTVQPAPPPITPQNAPYVPPAPANTPTTPTIVTPPPTFVPPAGTTHTAPPTLEPRTPEPRFGHRRRADDGRRRDHDDEVFGGMLDMDGDGDPDV